MAIYDRSADARLPRNLRLDFRALFGGSIVGWAALCVFSLIAVAAGIFDRFGASAAVWSAGSAALAAFLGAYCAVRLAGDRRRGESLAHGLVAWGMSVAIGALAFASFAPHAQLTRSGHALALAGLSSALLSLGTSLLGSLLAASRRSGLPLSRDLDFPERPRAGLSPDGSDPRREETTILPPLH